MLKSRGIIKSVHKLATQAPPPQLPDYFPSKSFMHVKVRRPGQKRHFVQVASEIELLKDVYGEERFEKLNIGDETWQILMELGWEERFSYLVDLMKFQRSAERKIDEKSMKNEQLMSIQNEERLINGEMVYARNFHSLLDIYGSEFRQKIDNFYGRNVIKQGEDIKKFIVDCRFLREFSVRTQTKYTNQMQRLHDENWLADYPFSISFSNYQADEQLVSIAKRNLLFQYGPPSKSADFCRHPFAPIITSRRIDAVEKKENLLYISTKATQYVPDRLPDHVKGVVVCLSDDSSPSTSSLSACISDRVSPYQLPFKRHISSDRFRPSSVQLWQLAKIFHLYFAGTPMDECILQNMDNLVRQRTGNQQSDEETEKEKVFRSSMYHINNCSMKRKEHQPSAREQRSSTAHSPRPSSAAAAPQYHRQRCT